MRTMIVLGVAAVGLAGCFSSTTVERRPAAVVYAQPVPTVVYQAPPTVVYQQPPTTVYSAPNQTIAVTYTGAGGFQLAEQKAESYCDDYGYSEARLMSDNRSAGRATFACVAN